MGESTADQAEALWHAERASKRLDAEELRRALRRRLGEEGLVEQASAVAAARCFPVPKQGMGLARSSRIDAIRYHAA